MRLALLVSLALLTAACSGGLPDYAAPSGQLMDPSRLDGSDVIGYRDLTRADFRAAEPPPEFAAHRDRLGAATCVHLLSTPETRVWIREQRSTSGESSFEATLLHVGFMARMDRNCSWWNASFTATPAEYVLQHEQIHFALHEIEARRLDARAGELRASVRISAASAEQAQREAQQAIRDALEETMEDALERNRDFDEDTSMGYRPARQKEWLSRVTEELAQTEAANLPRTAP